MNCTLHQIKLKQNGVYSEVYIVHVQNSKQKKKAQEAIGKLAVVAVGFRNEAKSLQPDTALQMQSRSFRVPSNSTHATVPTASASTPRFASHLNLQRGASANNVATTSITALQDLLQSTDMIIKADMPVDMKVSDTEVNPAKESVDQRSHA